MGKLDAATAALGIIAAACVLLSPVACTMNRHNVIAQAIKDGADPILAKCAIEGEIGHDPACVARSVAQKPIEVIRPK